MDDADEQQRQRLLISKLSEIVNELGWVIGMPAGEDMVPGLIIGTEQFVVDVVETYYGPNYSTFEEDPTGENQLVEKQKDPKKKGPVFH